MWVRRLWEGILHNRWGGYLLNILNRWRGRGCMKIWWIDASMTNWFHNFLCEFLFRGSVEGMRCCKLDCFRIFEYFFLNTYLAICDAIVIMWIVGRHIAIVFRAVIERVWEMKLTLLCLMFIERKRVFHEAVQQTRVEHFVFIVFFMWTNSPSMSTTTTAATINHIWISGYSTTFPSNPTSNYFWAEFFRRWRTFHYILFA